MVLVVPFGAALGQPEMIRVGDDRLAGAEAHRIARPAEHDVRYATDPGRLAAAIEDDIADMQVADWRKTARRRDRRLQTTYPPGTLKGDVLSIIIGIVAWAIFAFWLHGWLIGVNPFA